MVPNLPKGHHSKKFLQIFCDQLHKFCIEGNVGYLVDRTGNLSYKPCLVWGCLTLIIP